MVALDLGKNGLKLIISKVITGQGEGRGQILVKLCEHPLWMAPSVILN